MGDDSVDCVASQCYPLSRSSFVLFFVRGEHFSIELTYNYGVEGYNIGDGFNGMGLRLPDLEGIVARAKAAGGEIVSGPEVRFVLPLFVLLLLAMLLCCSPGCSLLRTIDVLC